MTAMLSLLQAAAAIAAPVPVAANVQLGCTVAMPGGVPVSASIDLRTKKPGVAALVADRDGPFSRVSATSEAVAWPADKAGQVAFTAATGNGRYRVELIFAGGIASGKARVQIVTVGDDGTPMRLAQGFCTPRPGKRLDGKKLAREPFDARPAPRRPVALRVMTDKLPDGTCRVIGADRSVHTLAYTIVAAAGNEATVTYRFDDPALAGGAGGTGAGVQFHLASPTERLFALTVPVGPQPSLYVHTTFERSGNWIDLTRSGDIVAQGECGTAIPAILAPAAGDAPR